MISTSRRDRISLACSAVSAVRISKSFARRATNIERMYASSSMARIEHFSATGNLPQAEGSARKGTERVRCIVSRERIVRASGGYSCAEKCAGVLHIKQSGEFENGEGARLSRDVKLCENTRNGNELEKNS